MLGIFDSGVGGLTVVRALKRARPDLSFVYLGDTARTPYGAKTPETIRVYSEEAVRFLKGKGAGAVIVACNTASSLAAGHLRERFPETPVFEVILPAVRAALRATKNGRIGVLGTRATVASGAYERALLAAEPETRVFSQAAPLLVPLVEEGWSATPEAAAVVGKYVAPLREEGIDALILACTHYPLLKDVIAERAGPGVRLIDSAEAAAEAFCATLEQDPGLERALDRKGVSSFYVTDLTPSFQPVASEWLGEPVAVEKTEL